MSAYRRRYRLPIRASTQLTSWLEPDRFEASAIDYAYNLLLGTPMLDQVSGVIDLDIFRQIALKGTRKRRFKNSTAEDNFIRTRLKAIRAAGGPKIATAPGKPIAKNMKILSQALGLSKCERETLQFLIACSQNQNLGALFRCFPARTISTVAKVISIAINQSKADVEGALNGMLTANGLITAEGLLSREEDPVELDKRILDLLLADKLTKEAVLQRFLPSAPASDLKADDFPYIKSELKTAQRLLQAGLGVHKKGINLLLYGPTGTGKTQLARILAANVGTQLYVAGKEDKDGLDPNARERLTSLMLGNKILAKSEAIIVFDEMEDIFRHQVFESFIRGEETKTGQMSKQWFNQLLENNPIPVIWISNSVAGVDPAFLRRFTYAIEMRPLSAGQRKRIWEHHLGDTKLEPKAVDQLATNFSVSPAQISNAVSSAKLLSSNATPDMATIESLVVPIEKLVSGKLRRAPRFDSISYLPEVLSTPVDLKAVADKLSGWKPGDGPGVSLCLYGPSGTGKSEFVRYLAHRMDRPLLVRRVSDIVSMWVGETEKNIAAAFREADQDGNFLLFDEADSFLRDRRGAVRSWEVSFVNEFLQQLEEFRGAVACTTNLYKDLDQASLRRFSFKIPFDYLKPEQALLMFKSVFANFLPGQMTTDDEAVVNASLRKFVNLAPGDFAAVSRRIKQIGISTSIGELLKELRAEAESKEAKPRAVGF